MSVYQNRPQKNKTSFQIWIRKNLMKVRILQQISAFVTNLKHQMIMGIT